MDAAPWCFGIRGVNAFAYLPEEDANAFKCPVLDAGIFVEPKDKNPADEDARQKALVAALKKCPAIAYHAVPNGGRQTDCARLRAERMGVIAGQPDLGIDWIGGSAVIEMKNGTDMPRPNQVDRLNRLHRMGKNVAVCRTVAGAVAWLRSKGAPVDRRGL